MSTNVHELRNVPTTVATARRAAAPSGGNRLLVALRHLGGRIALAHRRRRAIAELAALEDWQLDDIGIRRAQIREVVDGTLRSQSARR